MLKCLWSKSLQKYVLNAYNFKLNKTQYKSHKRTWYKKDINYLLHIGFILSHIKNYFHFNKVKKKKGCLKWERAIMKNEEKYNG